MQYKSLGRYLRGPGVLLLCIAAVAQAAHAPTPPQQEALRLEARMNQLEQRLYGIETSLRTLEQQSRLAGVPSRGVNQQDVAILSAQIQALQFRLIEDECGLARLDERTLSPATRDARRKAATRTDPCRTGFDAPLRLPESR